MTSFGCCLCVRVCGREAAWAAKQHRKWKIIKRLAKSLKCEEKKKKSCAKRWPIVRGTLARPGPARPWSSALHFISQEKEPRQKGQHLKGSAPTKDDVLFSPEPQTNVFIKQNLLVDRLLREKWTWSTKIFHISVYCHLQALTHVSTPLPLQGGFLHRPQPEQTMMSNSEHIKKARRALAGFVYDTWHVIHARNSKEYLGTPVSGCPELTSRCCRGQRRLHG